MHSLRHIKIRQLECFVEIARQNSVTKAAQVLNLTQPAVTRSLRELEDAIDAKLIKKHGRGIQLTQFGEIYLRYAGESLAAIRRGASALRDLVDHDGPPLRIGALPTVSARLMPTAIARYLESPARARPSITSGENRELLNQLREGALDLVIGRLPAPELMQGLKFDPLYAEKVVFVANSHHPIFHKQNFSIDEMERFPLLLPSKTSIIRPYVDRLFIEQGMSVSSMSIETVSDSFGRAFVREQNAIWIISEGVVKADIESGAFKTLPINTNTTLGAVGLNQVANDELSPSGQILVEILINLTQTSEYQGQNS